MRISFTLGQGKEAAGEALSLSDIQSTFSFFQFIFINIHMICRRKNHQINNASNANLFLNVRREAGGFDVITI